MNPNFNKMLNQHYATFVGFVYLYFCCNSVVSTQNYSTNGSICTSEIFCYGEILDTIQMAKLFPDSKTFVDMKLKASPEITIEKYRAWRKEHPGELSKDVVRAFVNDNFDKPGKEFEDYTPSDWKINPSFLETIQDADFKQWAIDLNNLWLQLGRKMTTEVANHPELFSIIHVEFPVIVPGGRFREFYYWDSYWIVKGLLHSEMYSTVKGMMRNFMSIIERFGFIPNGGRIYYLGRSQPPLLAAMIKSYVEATNDDDFIAESVGILDREFQYWLNNHMIEVNGHNLAIYGDTSKGPRPESYYEDIQTSKDFRTLEEKEDHYSELKAAAESGMDFSSRWFIKNGTNNGTLIDLKTRFIIPVELNAILYWNAKIIAEFYIKIGKKEKAVEFETRAQEFFVAVNEVLWNDEVGAWLDYDLINKKPRNYFVPTNLSPLWMKCYNTADVENITSKVMKYIKDFDLDQYPGGVPNSLEHTGEQWDFPNVWPPMQHMLIMGLDSLGLKEPQELAYNWASRWVQSNFIAYKSTRAMYEKYMATEMGGHGSGGEYEVQLGFGWTNGVILDLLAKYGDRLRTTEATGSAEHLKTRSLYGLSTVLLAVFSVLLTGILG